MKYDAELSADDMKQLVAHFKEYYKEKMGVDFPQDPKTQLMESVKAVFRSWDNPRANALPEDERYSRQLGDGR